ncbi:DUF2267 domain-containing protein [Actinoplanes sp. TBRC 11911]|uniref:DUF2267 domain-containing protein n=1 Tax=Actinoplanes sp. TBRC 11911 TaxID=2729386 RepID=UPI00145D7228|nr:DUF2267 domain-containing protein [Actinoplanes sp. TBRC 11911]NMO57884.1 DUF2267 domain-containing protein [Actinoplanes sp. TBRC 11911]
MDLLVTVQERGRLHGPNETRRAVRAVLAALCDVLPPPIFQRLAVHLPSPLRMGLRDSGVPVSGCHDFVSRIGDRLLVDDPNAAFLARIILEQLNAVRHGHTPAQFADLAPADLRPLLRASAPAHTPVVRAGRRRPTDLRHRRQAVRR